MAHHGITFRSRTNFPVNLSDAARPISGCFTPKSGHWLARQVCPLSAKSGHKLLLDFHSCSHQFTVRRARLQSPGYPRHFAQELRLSPLIGLETLGNA